MSGSRMRQLFSDTRLLMMISTSHDIMFTGSGDPCLIGSCLCTRLMHFWHDYPVRRLAPAPSCTQTSILECTRVDIGYELLPKQLLRSHTESRMIRMAGQAAPFSAPPNFRISANDWHSRIIRTHTQTRAFLSLTSSHVTFGQGLDALLVWTEDEPSMRPAFGVTLISVYEIRASFCLTPAFKYREK